MSETVWLATGTSTGGASYHTERDCKALQHAHVNSIVAKDKEHVERNHDLCQLCAGEKRNTGSTNNAHYKAAMSHGEEQ